MKHSIRNSYEGQMGKTIFHLLISILVLGLAFSLSPGTFATDDIVFNLDAQGPDDVPNQSDISQSGFSDNHLVAPFDPYDSAYYDVSWTFDDTDRTGANSADACAFFDSDDAGGFADFAMCASFQENAAGTALELVEVKLFDCKNNEPNPDEGARCPFNGGGGDGSSGVIASGTAPFADPTIGALNNNPGFDSFCTLTVNVPDPFAGVPGREGEQNPFLDDEVECIVFVDEMMELNDPNPPTGIELSNVCSFTSLDPNSERKDCIDIPSTLTIVKETVNGTNDTFNFTLEGQEPISVATLDGTGTSEILILPEGSYNLTEDLTGNDEWELLSAVCENDDGVITDLLLSNGALTLESKENEICTFTNSLVPNPLIKLVKTGVKSDAGDGDDAGDEFAYTFMVTNIGNVPLNPVTVADPLINNQLDLIDINCGAEPVILNPNANNPNTPPYLDGDSVDCTATYILTQTDIDNNGNGTGPNEDDGKIYNTATASGTDPDNTVVTDMDDEMLMIMQDPEMSVEKSSVTTSLNAPTLVTYDYIVSNDGNVTLTGVGINDDNDNDDASCTSDTIAVGGSTTCSATHTFTQAELTAKGSPTPASGVLFNNVTAFSNEAPDAFDDLSIPIISIFLTKELNFFTNVDGSVDINNDPTITLGDILFYKFTVTNTGSLDLTPTGAVFVEDLTFALTVTCDAAILAPGASTDCETTNGHEVTLAEANAGQVFNEAIARGEDEFGLPVTFTTPVVITPVDADPKIEIIKSTNGSSASDPNAGDAPIIPIGGQVSWTYKVTNTGNVTITNIDVSDDQSLLVSCPQTTLVPDEMMTCTASGIAEDLLDTTFTTVLGLCGSYPNTPLYENKGIATGSVTNGTLEPDDDLSHYCNPQEGTLKLVKVVENDNGGTATVTDFGITTNADGDFSFGTGNTVDTTTTYMTVVVTVAKGDYTFSEDDFAGYTEGSWSCNGSPAGSFDAGSVSIDTGQDVVCSITNDDDAPSLTLVKHVITDNGGTADASAWTLHAGANSVAGSEAGALATVIAGSYALSESGGPSDYTASGWTCVGNADDGSDGTIDLGLGEDVTCTINNDDDAPKLTLVKHVITDNGGTAVAGDWMLNAGANTVTGSEAGAVATVIAGSYALSESGGPLDYTASGWTCVGNADDGSDGSIDLGLGEDVTCTINNDDDAPKLTLIKSLVKDNGGTETADQWTLTAAGPTGFSGTTGVMSDASFDQGSYDLSELGPDNYTASDWDCVGGTQDDADTITLALGEEATCTITNDDDAPKLTLIKEVINGALPGGGAVATDWTLTATGPTGFAGTTGVMSDASFDQGAYNLSEASAFDAQYDAGNWSCVGNGDAAADGSLDIGLGDEVTCTITNTSKGDVDLEKFENGSPANSAFTFTLTGDGVNETDSSINIIDFGHPNPPGDNWLSYGEYTICETGIPAGTTSYWTLNGIPLAFVGPQSGAVNEVYNPDDDGQPDPDDLGNRCVDFDLQPGNDMQFEVDNVTPLGDARTPGYWKNWSSCSNGNQFAKAADELTNGVDPRHYTLDEILTESYGNPRLDLIHTYDNGVMIGDIMIDGDSDGNVYNGTNDADCATGVLVLNSADHGPTTKRKPKNHSNDPAYKLGRYLLAYIANQTAGAYSCGLAADAADAAQMLLKDLGFDGTGQYLDSKTIRRNDALIELAGDALYYHSILGQYVENDPALDCEGTL